MAHFLPTCPYGLLEKIVEPHTASRNDGSKLCRNRKSWVVARTAYAAMDPPSNAVWLTVEAIRHLFHPRIVSLPFLPDLAARHIDADSNHGR
jgi:hypothetical protein